MDQATENGSNDGSAERRLEQLYDLIDGIEVAMLTTRRVDGALVSRPMQTQARRPGTDLWFMTLLDSAKLEELTHDSNVNLAYCKSSGREFVSVSGHARITQDRELIRQLYRPDWKAWLEDEGGERDGGPDDPRIVLIEVQAESASYLKVDEPRVVTWFKLARAMVTGDRPNIGDAEKLDKTELEQGEGRR